MQAHGFKDYQEEWWHYTLENEPFPDTYFNFTAEEINSTPWIAAVILKYILFFRQKMLYDVETWNNKKILKKLFLFKTLI